jgi:hypothetical protein
VAIPIVVFPFTIVATAISQLLNTVAIHLVEFPIAFVATAIGLL